MPMYLKSGFCVVSLVVSPCKSGKKCLQMLAEPKKER